MLNALDSAVGAINAFSTKLDVSANNIANSQSDGFKKDRVTLGEGPGGGVQAEVEKISTPGPQVGEETAEGYKVTEKSNVELAEEMVGMMTAGYGVAANLKTIQAQDEMLGMILDLKR